MEKSCMEIPVSVALLWFSTLLCSAKETKMLKMDSRGLCAGSNPSTVYWASKDKTILVIGRGASDRRLYRDCSVVIGAATAQSSVLQLKFEAFHIQDCGVTLVVNQSQHSDFSSDSTTMAKIGCGHGKVSMLHSMEKHYVKITLHKDNAHLQQYNFRINITVIDVAQPFSDSAKHSHSAEMGLEARSAGTHGPNPLEANNREVSVNGTYEKLPETGPETHVVIIVGVTVLIVVGTALWLLVKYLIHRTQRWQERCAERNMERAIRLYNNQETPPESDYMYTALPPQDVDTNSLSAPSHRNGHCHPSKHAGGRGGRHRAGDITFVHADGHMETFRMRSSPQQRRSEHLDHTPASGTPRPAGVAPRSRDRDSESVAEDNLPGEDVLGECPPSYEEALHMPTPQDPRSAMYVNLDTGDDKRAT